jgi:hypothetical protein
MMHGETDYGEDAINGMYFINDQTQCRVSAWDDELGPLGIYGMQQRRRVGVLCMDSTIPESDINYVTQTFSGTDQYYTAESPICGITTDNVMVPISCTIEPDASDTDNEITSIDIDETNRKCKVTFYDNEGSVEFKGTIGAVCAKSTNVDIYKDSAFKRIEFENPFFVSQLCPSGIAVSGISTVESGSAEFSNDHIISIIPNSENGFVIQADDEGDNKKHSRKVGVVCLNNFDSSFG